MTSPFHTGGAGAVPTSSVTAPSRGELVDDVLAAVDIKRLAGDQARRVVRQERGGDAHIVDADEAAGRSLRLCFVEELVELWDARSCPRCQRSRRDGVHA